MRHRCQGLNGGTNSCIKSPKRPSILQFGLENNPKQIHTLIGLKPYLYNSIETELAQAVDIMTP